MFEPGRKDRVAVSVPLDIEVNLYYRNIDSCFPSPSWRV